MKKTVLKIWLNNCWSEVFPETYARFVKRSDGITNVESSLKQIEDKLDDALVGVYKYQGQVNTFEKLPADAQNGFVYEVLTEHEGYEAGTNWVWDGTKWDPMRANLTKLESKSTVTVGGEPVETFDADKKLNSRVQMSFVYEGKNIVLKAGTKGTQKGDAIPGAEAIGKQAVAFGGLRWDYYTNAKTLAYNQSIDATVTEHWGRTSTSAEGIQSFAAGGSSHAYGDWSSAIGKDTIAYQCASASMGGGNIAGMPEEEFNAIQNGQNPEVSATNDEEGKGWEKSYSFAFATGSENKAYGRNSFVAGCDNEAWAINSASFGNHNRVYSKNSFTTGLWNKLTNRAENALVAGAFNEVAGANSLVAGGGSKYDSASGTWVNTPNILSSGATSTATVGTNNKIYGANNIVGGDNNTISGWNNVVSGFDNILGYVGQSAVFGGKNRLLDNVNFSFISGAYNEISHNRSALMGVGLRSTMADGTVVGKYNKLNSNAIFVVGNGSGSADADRKNAFEVLADGRARVGAAPRANMDVATKGYVDNKISSTIYNLSYDESLGFYRTTYNTNLGRTALVIQINGGKEIYLPYVWVTSGSMEGQVVFFVEDTLVVATLRSYGMYTAVSFNKSITELGVVPVKIIVG